MNDEDLEKIKQEKLNQLMKEQQSQQQKQVEMQQQIAQLEAVVKTRLTRDALSRYGNIKAAFPEKAVQLLVVLARSIQSGQAEMINDNQLKEILKKITPKQREIKIKK